MLYDWRNTTEEVGAAGPNLALLPVAATEQHGEHLPVGAKRLILDTIARRVGESLPGPVYLLPTLPYGTSASHDGTAGTVSLSWRTLAAVVRDLVESLLCQGMRKVVVFPGLGAAHVGAQPSENTILKTVVRQLNYDHPDLQAIWAQPFSKAAAELATIFETAELEVHAGEVITSVLLHLAPELVQGLGSGFAPAAGRDLLDAVPFAALCPDGVWGYPGLASAEKGARALESVVRCTVRYVTETFEQLARMRAL